jgi:hypothetical protein
MANGRTLIEMRREGFITAECDRRMGPFLVKDLYGFGDVMGYHPLHLKRKRLVNGCLEDVNLHIKKYLEGGLKENGERFGPNEHLVNLIMEGFDLYIYSFVKRKMRSKDGKLLDRILYYCRKWKAIVSPSGQVSFELETES